MSRFLVETDDFLKIGALIGKLTMPVVFVMEGGYAVDNVGHNVVNVLTGSWIDGPDGAPLRALRGGSRKHLACLLARSGRAPYLFKQRFVFQTRPVS
jgi:hypothetical protein